MWTFIELNLIQLTDSKGHLNETNVNNHKSSNIARLYQEDTWVTWKLCLFTVVNMVHYKTRTSKGAVGEVQLVQRGVMHSHIVHKSLIAIRRYEVTDFPWVFPAIYYTSS